jgi:DHA3 family macrolide efflux protein-like MFS transporter
MTQARSASTASTFSVFRNHNFTFLWSAQLVSTIGSALTSLAASIVIYRATGSALSVGLMLMATAAPSLFIGLLAGVFVDRWDRKRILIGADLVRAAIVLAIPSLIAVDVAWLYVMILMSSVVSQFFDPAHASLLPEIASDEELAAANSFLAISSFGSTAVGFAASGLIASRFPIAWAFYLDGLTFLVSALAIVFVDFKHRAGDGSGEVPSILENLREGASFLFDNQMLRSLLLVSIPTLLGAGLWNTLLLPFSEQALNATEFEFGIQEGVTSIGFVVGSLLMARLADRLREGQWIVIGYLCVGLAGMLYSRSISIPMAVLLVTVGGFANAPSAIARRLLIQRNVPGEIQGRVYSAFFVSRDVLFLLGMASAGLADTLPIRTVVLLSAGLITAAGVLGIVLPGLGRPTAEWLRNRTLLETAGAEIGLDAGRPATLADFATLTGLIPAMASLPDQTKESLVAMARVKGAEAGALIVRDGDRADEIYFILQGQAAAGQRSGEHEYRSLSVMGPGDFFGEIAALTDSNRTANVVAEKDSVLLEVPAEGLDLLVADPRIHYLMLAKMTERLTRTHMVDWPRISTLDRDVQRRLQRVRTTAQAGT